MELSRPTEYELLQQRIKHLEAENAYLKVRLASAEHDLLIYSRRCEAAGV